MKKNKGNTNIMKEEPSDKEPELQAIILADCFNTKLSPLTIKTPRVSYINPFFLYFINNMLI